MADEIDEEARIINEFSIEQYNKALELFSHFPSVSYLPTDLSELSDGIVMSEMLSDFSPSYFDINAITHETNGNWAVKAGNLRTLLNNLGFFFEEFLNRNADVETSSNLVTKVAQSSCIDGIISILELVMIAVVKADQPRLVEKVMLLDSPSQEVWMSLASRGSKRVDDIISPQIQHEHNSPTSYGETGMMSPISTTGLPLLSPVSHSCFSMENDCSPILMERYGVTHFHGNNSIDIESVTKDRDELRDELEQSKRDNSSLRSNIESITSETEIDRRKFYTLVQDLEKQLASKDDELQSLNIELSRMKGGLDNAKIDIDELKEKQAHLLDQADLADATSLRLQKAEITLNIYKQKLEKAGDLTESINDLEDRTETYMLKNIELEKTCKKIPKLEETVRDLKKKLTIAERRNHEQEELYRQTYKENELLNIKLVSSERRATSYRKEAMELREQQRIGSDMENDINTVSDITLASAASSTISREKIIRLEIENSNLKEQLARSKQDSMNYIHHTDEVDDVTNYQEKYKYQLESNTKLKREKDKLQFHTKSQLDKFQQKYLTALHECKMKLSEKQDIIVKQDARMKNERGAHKREERLLSYTVYEMGSAVMQMQMARKAK